jgi:hypothetical protein
VTASPAQTAPPSGGTRQASGYSPRAAAFFAERGIEPAVAARAGVAERGGALTFTVLGRDGIFERTRRIAGSGPAKVLQPRGRRLELWWPHWRPEYAPSVLLVEGETDALAAASALASGPLTRFDELPIAALPGCGFPVRRLVDELLWVECRLIYFALDADQAGRKFTRQACHALDPEGIRTAVVSLPDGADLAETAVAVAPERRGKWIVELLQGAEAGPR